MGTSVYPSSTIPFATAASVGCTMIELSDDEASPSSPIPMSNNKTVGAHMYDGVLSPQQHQHLQFDASIARLIAARAPSVESFAALGLPTPQPRAPSAVPTARSLIDMFSPANAYAYVYAPAAGGAAARPRTPAASSFLAMQRETPLQHGGNRGLHAGVHAALGVPTPGGSAVGVGHQQRVVDPDDI